MSACQALFVYLDVSDEDNERPLDFFGISKEDCPAYYLIEFGTDPLVKYQPDSQDLTSSGIQSFVQAYLDGTITVRISNYMHSCMPLDFCC